MTLVNFCRQLEKSLVFEAGSSGKTSKAAPASRRSFKAEAKSSKQTVSPRLGVDEKTRFFHQLEFFFCDYIFCFAAFEAHEE